MSTICLQRGADRETFVKKAFEQFDIQGKAEGKKVLVKPNIVSHEPYPTTTHPAVLEACLELLLGSVDSILVADGPAFDARDHKYIIEEHPLQKSCQKFGIEMIDLLSRGTRRLGTRTMELEVSVLASECDFIISLPVLKSHGICGMTGALKNVLGFLSPDEKRHLHYGGDVHRIIVELNEVIVPDMHIMDAVYTMVNTNEVRHGGKPRELGYMLAGTDPVSLDVRGLELLGEVEPKLKGKHIDDILHLRHAVQMTGWDGGYEVIKW